MISFLLLEVHMGVVRAVCKEEKYVKRKRGQERAPGGQHRQITKRFGQGWGFQAKELTLTLWAKTLEGLQIHELAWATSKPWT